MLNKTQSSFGYKRYNNTKATLRILVASFIFSTALVLLKLNVENKEGFVTWQADDVVKQLLSFHLGFLTRGYYS